MFVFRTSIHHTLMAHAKAHELANKFMCSFWTDVMTCCCVRKAYVRVICLWFHCVDCATLRLSWGSGSFDLFSSQIHWKWLRFRLESQPTLPQNLLLCELCYTRIADQRSFLTDSEKELPRRWLPASFCCSFLYRKIPRHWSSATGGSIYNGLTRRWSYWWQASLSFYVRHVRLLLHRCEVGVFHLFRFFVLYIATVTYYVFVWSPRHGTEYGSPRQC